MDRVKAFAISKSVMAAMERMPVLRPSTWFSWTAAVTGSSIRLARINSFEDENLEGLLTWYELVIAAGCQPILVHDSRTSLDLLRPRMVASVWPLPIDPTDEASIIELLAELAAPEEKFLGQWSRAAIGGGVPFRWLHASPSVWRGYADGLKQWIGRSDIESLLQQLNLPDYRQWQTEVQFTPSEFVWPKEVLSVEESLDLFIPNVFNPACGIGTRNGRVTTFGLLPDGSPWPWDVSEQVRARLQSLIDSQPYLQATPVSKFVAATLTAIESVTRQTREASYELARRTQFTLSSIIGLQPDVALSDRGENYIDLFISDNLSKDISSELIDTWREAVLTIERLGNRLILTLERCPQGQGIVVAIGADQIIELEEGKTYQTARASANFAEEQIGIAIYSIQETQRESRDVDS